MSRIPTSAMPRANAPTEGKEEKGAGASIKKQARGISDKAKDNPKTAIAAGAVVAGVIAAAAIPLVRAATAKDSKKSDKKSDGSGGSKKKKS